MSARQLKYIIGKEIGEGEFGKVFYATNTASQRGVAVKVISRNKLEEAPFLLETLKTEVHFLSQENNPPHYQNGRYRRGRRCHIFTL